MSIEKALAETLADVATGEVLAGAHPDVLLAALAKAGDVALSRAEVAAALGSRKPALSLPPTQRVLRDLPAMHPTDAARAIIAGGERLRASLDELAHLFPAIKKGMSAKDLGKAIGDPRALTHEAITLERAAQKQGLLDWLDLDSGGARALFRDAVKNLNDATLAAKVTDLEQRIPLHGDLETYVRRVAQELTEMDGKKLVRAVHTRICQETITRLSGALGSKALQKRAEDALAAAIASEGDLVRTFHQHLKSEFAGGAVADEVAMVIAGLDGTARARAVNEIFAAIADGPAKAMLEANFDDAGRRRLLATFASFKKLYSDVRRSKAMENLIGWMYEASRFVANLVVESTERTHKQLIASITNRRDLNVEVGLPFYHFDAVAPTASKKSKKSKKSFRQATDVTSTISLSANRRTVNLLATAIESKGESGVMAGLEQLAILSKRLAKGNTLRTEHGIELVANENLFLSVEDALVALNVPGTTAREVAGEVDHLRRRIVVSPLPEDVVKKKYPELFKGLFEYRAHPVPRADMVRLAEALAPSAELLIRDVAP